MKKKHLLIIVIVLLLLWVAVALTDFLLVKNGKNALFKYDMEGNGSWCYPTEVRYYGVFYTVSRIYTSKDTKTEFRICFLNCRRPLLSCGY